jgi:hypothetical protein
MYDVAKNPKDKKWYVIGQCGGGYWMVVSSAFNSKKAAQQHAKSQPQVDQAARQLLSDI